MIDWEYAPAPESTAIAAIKDRYLPYIDGTFVEGNGEDLDSINPGTGEKLTTISTVDDADLDRAVKAARKAYDGAWSSMSGAERGKYLFRIARGIAERARELAVVETLDNGKPIKETRDFDVPTAAQHFFYHAGWADKLQHLGLGPAPAPLGVAGQVIPWNFPLLMAAWKIAPALAAGNTVVIKPAETTSVSILVLAEIIADAGLPPGVVNIVPGCRRDRAQPGQPPRTGQGGVHGLHRGRPRHREVAGRHRSQGHARAGRQGRQHRLRRRRPGSGDRGHRQRHLLQPGPGLLRRITSAGPGIHRRGVRRQAEGPGGDPPGRRPAGQEHRRRRDQLGCPAGADHYPARRRGWTRVRRSGRRPARSRSTATTSRRRSSPTPRRRCGSPGTRSSDRSSP